MNHLSGDFVCYGAHCFFIERGVVALLKYIYFNQL